MSDEEYQRRMDGICPKCGIRPKFIRKDGSKNAYCRECETIRVKNHPSYMRPKRDPDEALEFAQGK